MASIFFTSMGRHIGNSLFGKTIGEGLAGNIGGNLGKLAGSFLENLLKNEESTNPHYFEQKNIQTHNYGKIIPIIYGRYKLNGNIIWASEIQEMKYFTSKKIDSSFSLFNMVSQKKQANYEYKINIAIGLAEGEITSIERIWANNQLLDLRNYQITIYKGSEEQMPDPLMESYLGKNQVPAYRGLAYVVIKDFSLKEFGNNLPNFSFEIVRKDLAKITNEQKKLEEMIESVVIIPGSGEFVYDTEIQYRFSGYINNDLKTNNGANFTRTSPNVPINMNNHEYRPDALLALDQLQETCPNLQWVSVVVNWFANSLNIANSSIKPGAENNGLFMMTEPDVWKVAGITRDKAYIISKTEKNEVAYGGTVSDNSVIRYLKEIKRRNLSSVFYPMFLLDDQVKTWRGRVTGDISQVAQFFNKSDGYNNFILHYARLTAPYIDSFIIGSELIGLTSITDGLGNFPAIDELINLAKKVRQILPAKVKISYAADWSEYHHTANGWYNMDKLWASEYIDYIGIDAYFPLTNVEHSASMSEIIKGWESGEGYDYFYKNSKTRTEKSKIAPAYAWKNIRFWWENEHYQPNGKKSAWVPKQKKIWFTEYGFPSVDCSTNQPNFFLDAESCESNLPIYSRGKIDFTAQRDAIMATEMKWSKSDMVERKFVWCWDARPYPFWPDKLWVWRDGCNWQTGHWLNGKLGLLGLNLVIIDICLKSGLKLADIDVSLIESSVDGFIIDHFLSARHVIEMLQKAYFFDVIESEGKLKFVPKIRELTEKIDSENLIRNQDEVSDHILEINLKNKLELARKVSILFADKRENYRKSLETATKDFTDSKIEEIIDLNLAFERQYARKIAEIFLYNQEISRISYQFSLPKKYIYLEPGDVIQLNSKKSNHVMRIQQIELTKDLVMNVRASSEDLSIYNLSYLRQNSHFGKNISSEKLGLINFEIDIIVFLVYQGEIKYLFLAIISKEKIERLQNSFLTIRDLNYKSENIVRISQFSTSGKADLTKMGEINFALINGKIGDFPLYHAIYDNKIISFKKFFNVSQNLYKILDFSFSEISVELLGENNKEHNFFLLDENLQQIELEEDDKQRMLEVGITMQNKKTSKKVINL